MKTIVLATIAIIMLMSRAIGQETKVHAYDINGAINYKRGNTGNWNLLTSETMLYLNDMLKMPARSSVLLMSEKSHGAIACRKDSVVIVGNTLVEEDGFWESLCTTIISYIRPKKPKYESASISRGNDKMLFPAKGELVNAGKVQFLWSKNKEGNEHFVLKEHTGTYTTLCNKNGIADTTLSLPDKGQCPGLNQFEASKTYVWTVFTANRNDAMSNFISFSLANNKTINDVNTEIAGLRAKKTSTDGRLYALMEAIVYEKYKMYSAANTIYLNALALYPSSVLVKDAYNNFIDRIALMN